MKLSAAEDIFLEALTDPKLAHVAGDILQCLWAVDSCATATGARVEVACQEISSKPWKGPRCWSRWKPCRMKDLLEAQVIVGEAGRRLQERHCPFLGMAHLAASGHADEGQWRAFASLATDAFRCARVGQGRCPGGALAGVTLVEGLRTWRRVELGDGLAVQRRVVLKWPLTMVSSVG